MNRNLVIALAFEFNNGLYVVFYIILRGYKTISTSYSILYHRIIV